MSPDGSAINAGLQSGWHSIRPWMPPISLSVREITSVSVTFVMSSNLSDLGGDLEPSLVGLITVGENKDEDNAEGSSYLDVLDIRKSIISDALAKGLSVNVNGSPWQRVFIRIDDAADEAIIIIYGLMPGRQYDIDLGLVHGDSNNNIRRQVITNEVELQPESVEEHTDPDSPSFGHSTTSDPPSSTPSTSPNRTLPNTPPSVSTPLTIEDRFNQLQHTLALINNERDTLSVSLKSARRDAQKADAALRSEIDILKRASEKHVAAEHRAKQKILSLQEALKRAQAATREAEELVKEVEGMVPELNKKKEEKEAEYAKIKEDADRVRKEREYLAEKEKKKVEAMQGELAGLTNKMEKLNAKREKLETGVISELEEQLKDIEREIERAEVDSYASSYTPPVDRQEFIVDEPSSPITDVSVDHSLASSYLPIQRARPQTLHPPGAIGRPSPAPIQRPTINEMTLGTQTQLRNPLPRQTAQAHSPRSSSLHHQTPVLLVNRQRQLSLKSINTANPPAPTSAPSASSPTVTNANSTTSTLSSRAPAFEPGRPLKASGATTGTSSGFSASPTPIQRPAASGSRGLGFNGNPQTKSSPWAGLRSAYDDGRG